MVTALGSARKAENGSGSRHDPASGGRSQGCMLRPDSPNTPHAFWGSGSGRMPLSLGAGSARRARQSWARCSRRQQYTNTIPTRQMRSWLSSVTRCWIWWDLFCSPKRCGSCEVSGWFPHHHGCAGPCDRPAVLVAAGGSSGAAFGRRLGADSG
jgi:hypothetical protein